MHIASGVPNPILVIIERLDFCDSCLMETPLSKLCFVFLGTYISICAIVFNAQKIHCLPENRHLQSSPRPPSLPPPVAQPPPDSPPERIESRSSPDSPPPPPPHRPRAPHQQHKNSNSTKPSNPSSSGSRNVHKRKLPPPPSASGKMNSGKIVGLTFLAFGGVLQFAVIVFLAVKRRQLF